MSQHSSSSNSSTDSVDYEEYRSDYDLDDEETEELAIAENASEEIDKHIQKLSIITPENVEKYENGWSSVPPQTIDNFAYKGDGMKPEFPSNIVECFGLFMPDFLIEK